MSRASAASVFACVLGAMSSAEAEELAFDCMIEPSHQVELGTAAEGVIEHVWVERGERVEAGQLLVELESAVEQATVEVALERSQARGSTKQNEIRLAYSEQVLSRSRELQENQILAISKLDEARATQELAQAGILQAEEDRRLAAKELARAEALLELRKLHSPFDGIVTARLREPGELNTEEPILELAVVDSLHVEAYIPTRFFGRIQQGMRATVQPEAPVGGEHLAEVSIVDPIVDAASGTFGVRAVLPNPEGRIPAGLECRVIFSEAETVAVEQEETP